MSKTHKEILTIYKFKPGQQANNMRKSTPYVKSMKERMS